MYLRLPTLGRTPRRRHIGVLAALALGVLSLGQAAGTAAGTSGTGSYPSTTLYLTNASGSVTGSYQLTGASPPTQPATTPTVCTAILCPAGGLSGTYNYEYTIGDSTYGETASSTASNSVSVGSKSITVGNLPTGVTVYLYRQRTLPSVTQYTRVATLTNNASSSYTDNATDATALAAPVLPVSQNRVQLSTTGYLTFAPGNQAPPTATTALDNSTLTTPSGNGWIVSGDGGVKFPTGSWTFQAKMKQNASTVGSPPLGGVAHLVVGMWAVSVSGSAIGSSPTLLVDPTCSASPCASGAAPGENTTSFMTASGTFTAQQIVTVNGFTLQRGQHLYVQYWRRESTQMTSGSATNQLATMFTGDGMAKIVHPTASALPDAPSLVAPGDGVRTNDTTPELQASYSDPDGNPGTLTFQLCTTSDCATLYGAASTTSSLASGANGSWTTGGLPDGRYYWEVTATDSTSGNTATSAIHSFTIDTVPPEVPTYASPADSARVNSGTLSAVFIDSDPTDSGQVDFQVCSDSSCAHLVDGRSSSIVSGSPPNTVSVGAVGMTGTPPAQYYWRIRGTDVAGNPSAWTTPRAFTYDTHPPALLASSGPADGTFFKTPPTFTGKFSADGDAGDSGSINVQLCSDSACGAPAAWSGSSARGLADGAVGTVTPSAGGLPDGTYYWRVQAQDAAGNTSAWPTTPPALSGFTYDTQKPSVAVASIASRVNVPPVISATYSDPAPETAGGTVSIDLCLDAACASVLDSTMQSAAIGSTVQLDPGALPDGVYYYRVGGEDPAGNDSTAVTGGFTVDSVPPGTPTLASPAAGGRTNAATLGATFVDSDATDSGTVTFELCDDAACSSVRATSPASAVVSNGGGVSWTAPAPAADGTYYWRAQATDVAGNVGAWSAVRSFVLDRVAPAAPTLGTVSARVDSAPRLSASFDDADVGDTGTLEFQVCSDSACNTVAASGASASVANGATATWTASGLAAGSYWWRAAAKDAAGNQTWSGTAGPFVLDTTAPSVPTTTSPAPGARLNQPPSLSAVYVDPGAGAGDSGTVTFELCPTSTCLAPLLTKTTNPLAAGTAASWTPSLGDGTYYWRVASQDAAGNASAWTAPASFVVDSTPPSAPTLLSASGLRVRTSPALTARIDDPSDPGDSARLYVEVCPDAACTTVLADGYSALVPDGKTAGWAAPALADGTYYWHALAEDAVGNRSGWSDTRSFVVDDAPPTDPAAGGPGDGAIVDAIRLTAVYPGSDPADAGSLEFQLCTDSGCATVVAGGVAAASAGQTASWTADASSLANGVYFWRVRAKDGAGNVSAWSDVRSIVLDAAPPTPPRKLTATVTGRVLTLTWRPPAKVKGLRGYVLIIDGKRTRTLTPKTLTIRIQLRPGDRRSFAVAAVDRAGNVSDATRTVETVGPRLSVKQVRAIGAYHHR